VGNREVKRFLEGKKPIRNIWREEKYGPLLPPYIGKAACISQRKQHILPHAQGYFLSMAKIFIME